MSENNLPDSEARKIGRRIAMFRDAAGMTNADLAARLNVSEDAVRKTVTGAAAKRYAELKRLACALGVTPNDILEVSDSRDLDEVLATVHGSYRMMGLSDAEAAALVALVREVIEEPLTPTAKPDRIAARRILAESQTRRFFSSKRPRAPLA